MGEPGGIVEPAGMGEPGGKGKPGGTGESLLKDSVMKRRFLSVGARRAGRPAT
jgi:hypothetical protein